jgi:flavin-binding protein dodecin
MSDFSGSLATVLEPAPTDDVAASSGTRAETGGVLAETAPLEFVGSSDDTIAEAVRRALAHASASLQTLDGAGVVVIPQIDPGGAHPRFHVTLRVSPQAAQPDDARG